VHERGRRGASPPELVACGEAFQREADDPFLIRLQRRRVEQLIELSGTKGELRRQRREHIVVLHHRLAGVAERWRHRRAEPRGVIGRRRHGDRGHDEQDQHE